MALLLGTSLHQKILSAAEATRVSPWLSLPQGLSLHSCLESWVPCAPKEDAYRPSPGETAECCFFPTHWGKPAASPHTHHHAFSHWGKRSLPHCTQTQKGIRATALLSIDLLSCLCEQILVEELLGALSFFDSSWWGEGLGENFGMSFNGGYWEV